MSTLLGMELTLVVRTYVRHRSDEGEVIFQGSAGVSQRLQDL